MRSSPARHLLIALLVVCTTKVAAQPARAARDVVEPRIARDSLRTLSSPARMLAITRVERPTITSAPVSDDARRALVRLYGDRARLESATTIGQALTLVWLRPDTAARQDLELPFRIWGPHPLTGAEMSLVPIVDHMGGMRYSADAGRFEGRLLLGLRDSLAPTGVYALQSPLVIEIAHSELDAATPTLLTIRRVNEVSTRISVASARLPVRPELRLYPLSSSQRLTIPIPVLLDSLIVTPVTHMRGLGTEEREISIALPAGALGVRDSLWVEVTSTKGIISPSSSVLVRAGVPGTVRLRSSGIGVAVLSVRSGVTAPLTLPIGYTTPWLLLACAVTGAIVGVLLRSRRGRKGGRAVRVEWHRVVLSLVLVAAVSVGLGKLGLGYAVGLTEVGTFVMGALFAGGLTLFKWTDVGGEAAASGGAHSGSS